MERITGSGRSRDQVMAPLADPQILACFRDILANWNVTDYVTAKDMALEWVTTNCPGLSLKSLAKAMHDYFEAGGEIDQVRETRPEWNDRDYHYDFRVPF